MKSVSSCLAVRIDLLHPAVGKAGVKKTLDAVCRFPVVCAVVVARKSQHGDGDVDTHEGDETPGDDLPCPHRNPLNPAGEERVELLQPDDCGDAPEEGEQQVDSAAEIERQAAVIPEDLAEDDFREHAADVLVGAADEGAEGEDESVRMVTELYMMYVAMAIASPCQ